MGFRLGYRTGAADKGGVEVVAGAPRRAGYHGADNLDDKQAFLFAALVAIADEYIKTGISRDSMLAGLNENLDMVEESDTSPIPVGGEYPLALLDLDDAMAEFTLVEARLIVLSNVNGQQRMSGDHAVVLHYYRSGRAILKADGLTFKQAIRWCMDYLDIEA